MGVDKGDENGINFDGCVKSDPFDVVGELSRVV